MRKQDHSELFVIEAFNAPKGAPKISYPLWDVGFSTGDNFIHGSWDDCEQHASLNYGSIGSPFFVKKTND